VRIVFAPGGGGSLEVSISDSGTGVVPENRERIFDHGFSTKPAGADGRGVGLALVRSIVRAAGGTVDLSSSPTTFHVVLPGKRA
jgi:signal transduction histidine kinase